MRLPSPDPLVTRQTAASFLSTTHDPESPGVVNGVLSGMPIIGISHVKISDEPDLPSVHVRTMDFKELADPAVTPLTAPRLKTTCLAFAPIVEIGATLVRLRSPSSGKGRSLSKNR